jgi:hypothetical protein
MSRLRHTAYVECASNWAVEGRCSFANDKGGDEGIGEDDASLKVKAV